MILIHRDEDPGWLCEVRMGGCADDAEHELADYVDERTNPELREALDERMERFYWRAGRLCEMMEKEPSKKDRVWVIAPSRDLRAELDAARSLDEVKAVLAEVLVRAEARQVGGAAREGDV